MSPINSTGERILVVGPYAPYRDGIAAYVVQQVRALRREGHDVEVLSPLPSAAHHHLELDQPRAAAGLRRLAQGFDRLIVHFHPDYYFPQPATFSVRLSRAAALAAALRTSPPATLVLHEIDERWGQGRDAAAVAVRLFMGSFAAIEVHDEAQGEQLRRAFRIEAARIRTVDHGKDFVAHSHATRAEARTTLGIADEAHVSLCIGFVAEHKGFDRAVTAFGRVTAGTPGRAELHIVGAPSTGSDAAARYAVELGSLVAATPGSFLHDGYVSDAVFDRWLLAADLVLLPYRHIWSSGVAERAALFDRPVIATRVGGLAEQLEDQPGARIVDDDHGLLEAVAEALTAAGVRHAPVSAGSDWDDSSDRASVLAEVRHRAEAQRGFRFVHAESSVGGALAGGASTGEQPAQSGAGGRAGLDGRPATGLVAGTAASSDELDAAVAGLGRALASLRAIGPLARPAPVSGRPGVSGFKQVERRLLNWEMEPLIGWVDELRRATQQAVEATAALAAAQARQGAAEPSAVAASNKSRRSTSKPKGRGGR